MRRAMTCLLLVGLVPFIPAMAQDEEPRPTETEIARRAHDLSILLSELMQKETVTRKELKLLRERFDAVDAIKGDDVDLWRLAERAEKFLEAAEGEETGKKLAEIIGSSRPMTAVLFSGQDRNKFEVVADPSSGDPTIGIINQSQDGETAGILIAAESPFAYPENKAKGWTVPIGAWFGVNFSTGSGDPIDDVDLAAGISLAFVSELRRKRMLETGDAGFRESARLLIGLIYGSEVTLGPADSSSSLQPGDPYPLGATVPVRETKEIDFAFGIGFRF